MGNEQIFKTCSSCGTTWQSMKQFLEDKELVVEGYQASFSDSMDGLFLMTHSCEDCGSTLALKTGLFRELYHGPEFTEHRTNMPGCDGHCLNENDLEPCDQECDMRWVRDVLQMLKNYGAPMEKIIGS